MQRTLIARALASDEPRPDITVCGWIRTRRDAKGFTFLEVNDGSCRTNLQCIVDEGTDAHAALAQAGTGSSVCVQGSLVASPGQGQKWEIHAKTLTVFGEADPATYPLQKKRHSDEFLRTIAHLRPRTNKYGAMLRIRGKLTEAIHTFFWKNDFVCVQTPLLTGSDCEGAGELFRVTNLPPGETDIHKDFFKKTCRLTVSGQLEGEALACALGRIYTFGPTFRAEDSNTPRHAAEFWMIEPEMAFADLTDCMQLAQDLVQHAISHLLASAQDDLALFDRFVEKGLLDKLTSYTAKPFAHIPYTEGIDILRKSGRTFTYPVSFGIDLQTEHERYLAEEYVKGPVFITDYPKTIKPFYMRVNDDDRTVAAMDLLVPGIGEIIGGSQREERPDILAQRMNDQHLPEDDYAWYTDLRRFGTVPHAGFGLGFERLLMLVTGINNIRDVIAFPRTPGSLEF